MLRILGSNPSFYIMDNSAETSDCNENRPSENSTPPNEQKKAAENSTSTSVFVNHAAIAWDESRRKWTGDLSQRSPRIPKDPIISWSTTYEELLSTNDPFPNPIPLYKDLRDVDEQLRYPLIRK
ncbi:hypothetical protein DH2020_010582 [Rehmannia glutinosa]|uniref:DUF4050 domain-containing protein n=1 Tax=Rehmannia glutinosa TaxID=99300 RepID=A0ABR0XB03_REHGL